MNANLTLKNKAASKANIFFLIGLSISIPASKAGMNAFLYLYVLSSFVLLRANAIDLSKNQWLLLKSSLGVFLIGTILAFFSKGADNDIVVYIQKYFYLLVPIALVITTLENKKALKWSLASFLLSILVCLLIDFYQYAFIYNFFRDEPGRLWGQIGYSRWPVVLVTAISIFLLMELNAKDLRVKLLMILLAAFSFFGIILSGTKGGIVATAILGIFYIAIKMRKNWWIAPVMGALLVILVNSAFFQSTIASRLVVNESITLRILMIDTGLELTESNIKNDVPYFLFGGGIDKPEVPFQKALDKLPSKTLEKLTYQDLQWGHTDLHNSYLDQLLKNGFLFSLCFYAFVIFIAIQAYQALSTINRYKGLPTLFWGTLASYAIFNCFYSNFSDYAVYSQIYFIALAISLPIALCDETVNRT
ncbi:O-antigen ligase family protein [Vibrio mediterranei]|uniref:O-antigen ligase family protein n=1 Tax=Vibrio mediterranei TaxID=689 RepID=UPI001EFD14F3|nr:O-antigen ligase family protein [Vibrio mediterranei]MCG9626013.1 O-antigen ligase family protein [Vibrio mediterranei]